MNIKEWHKKESQLLIASVWDVASAKVAERLNFDAIATSSGAIATMLGYADGEEISFRELKYVVERIVKNVHLPLSVDLEAGYGSTAEEILPNINVLIELGVVGINLEDSKVSQGQRSLMDYHIFSGVLKDITSQLKLDRREVFINVRTDTFLKGLDNALGETLVRAEAYQKAGGNGLFVSCIEKEHDIEKVCKATDLPINVMCMPNLPNFDTLNELGVKRISMGNFVFEHMDKVLETTLTEVMSYQSFRTLFS